MLTRLVTRRFMWWLFRYTTFDTGAGKARYRLRAGGFSPRGR